MNAAASAATVLPLIPRRATTKEAACAVRAALKSAGYSRRQVSVRADCYSMGSSLYVTILDGSVSLATVERIAGLAERVDRDPASGEILCGGNRFVHVEVDRDVYALEETIARSLIDVLADGETATVFGHQVRRHGRFCRAFGGPLGDTGDTDPACLARRLAISAAVAA